MLAENAENMAKVKELMASAGQVRLGGELKAGVFIDYETELGTQIEGNVLFKRPTMGDYLKMGAIKSEYLRNAGVVNIQLVDNTVKYMAHVMATLAVVVVKCPEWLMDLNSIQEADILYHVFGKYEEWEKSFRKPTKGPVHADGETPGGAETLGS